MKVFMLGWEFPPSISGGLGVACYGLAKALNGAGVDVLFLLPKPIARNGTRDIVGGAGGGLTHRVRDVTIPDESTIRGAVENATSHAMLPPAHPPQAAPSLPAAPPHPQFHQRTRQVLHEKWIPREDRTDERLQRITFVPVDVWLEPYMTPSQYQKMIVEELSENAPVRRWEKVFEPHTETWIEQAVDDRGNAGPGAPVLRTPEPPRKRSYIDEPEGDQALLGEANTHYAGNLFEETDRYAALALGVSRTESFDVIHAHDWMTFEAAMAVAAETGKPLVVQIHSTELDRAGASANVKILEVEREGMVAARKVIAVSYRTKSQLVEKYGIDPTKIDVVYNAPDAANEETHPAANGNGNGSAAAPRKKHHTVLFLGRMTQQKGPDYFLHAARKILSVEPDVKFIMAGKGDMLEELKALAEDLDIHRRVIFTGHLKKSDTEKAFKAADVYVMPSVSEPFGIAPLEALSHEVPVIISKQSGVAEVLRHVLKVDFWDTEDLANKILAVLRHPPLGQTMRQFGQDELRQLSWNDSARRIITLYESLIGSPAGTDDEVDSQKQPTNPS